MRAERPILFSAPMVNAILDGTKTMTRRPTKEAQWNRRADSRLESVQPGWKVRGGPASSGNDWVATFVGGGSMPGGRWQKHALACPFGAPGDRLWVRETHAQAGTGRVFYRADPDTLAPRWTPAIHMPRWASRIDLEVTAVRVERLQDITEDDARAEGIGAARPDLAPLSALHPGRKPGQDMPSYRAAFWALWESINGARASWASNPWVWCVGFKRVRP